MMQIAPAEALELVTASDDAIHAELFRPPSETAVRGVVLAPEMYGLNDYVRQTASALAARGYLVLAVDVLAQIEPRLVLSYDGADNARAHEIHDVYDFAPTIASIQAAVDALRGNAQCTGRVGLVGYCLGGTIAYLAAIRTDVDAAVGYYGSRIVEFLDEAPRIARPLQLHFGGTDAVIPMSDVARILDATAANPLVTSTIHGGARHAFANHVRTDRYDAEAARRAENAMLAFYERTL